MKQNKIYYIIALILLVVTLGITPSSTSAQDRGNSPIFIRDAEIEHNLRTYAVPLFKAAGLPPENVEIFIIQDDSLNAFVSGGMNIFVHTGLLTESTDPLLLIGVLAHETGHISGGHLIRKNEPHEKALLGTALSYVLGAATVAAGSSAAGAAIISGGQHIVNRNLLSHSRIHEQSADQAALSYLDKSGFSAKGLLKLLETLGNRETLFHEDVDQYALTHPLSQQRIAHIGNHIAQSPIANSTPSEKLQEMQARIVAKIKSFLGDPKKTLEEYPESDTSIAGHYARAVAYHKKSDLPLALKEMDILLEMRPNDPYFHELKGQILFEHGRVKDSIPFYKKSVELIPESALLKLELATAQIASEDNTVLPEAIVTLEKALVRNPKNVGAWRQIATAYGRNGQLGKSYLSLAEEAALLKNEDEVKRLIKLAREHMKDNEAGLLRANDLEKFIINKAKKDENT